MYNNYEKVELWLRGGKMKRYDMISKKRTDYRVKHVRDILDLLYPELEKTLSDCSVLVNTSGFFWIFANAFQVIGKKDS